MKFSLEWIREYVDDGLPPAEVGARLTAVGIPLDGIERVGDDTVFDFDVTTNRVDCMNHLGLARELAAATGAKLREPDAEVTEAPDLSAAKTASVAVESEDLCGRYTARVIAGVKVGPSPAWLLRRLAAIGQRPINSVVDATNFVLWELGHPLHAFDLHRLEQRRILVRRARKGETLRTLDGLDRKLDPEVLVIADGKRPVALAGVMGGFDSEISETTTDVLLESAHFDPVSIRRTARRFGLHTDASHRFERGADLEATRKAADRCARLIAEIAGGRVASGALDCRSAPPFSRGVPLRPARASGLLGVEVPPSGIRGILERLGCRVDASDAARWRVAIPSFRGDLALEEDLVEEIARHFGYDRIPSTLPRVFGMPEGRPEPDRLGAMVRQAMVRSGFVEAINLSLVSAADNERLERAGAGFRVTNPLAEGQDRLRTTLLPGLLRNVAHNLNHGAPEVRLFEVGNAFLPSRAPSGAPDEQERLAWVCAGKGGAKHWSAEPQAPDLFDLKGAVEVAARLLGVPAPEWSPARRDHLVPGSSAEAVCDGASAGAAGELSRAIAQAYGIEAPVFVAEIALARLWAPRAAGAVPRHAPLPRTPAVTRDLSILLDASRSYSEVERTIREVQGVPLVRVVLFDRYEGEQVPDGKVSLAVKVVLRDPRRTLLSEEVSGMMERIVQRLRERLGAVLRGN
jgi:phenylalanyl-tRNA synthetase beta chain